MHEKDEIKKRTKKKECRTETKGERKISLTVLRIPVSIIIAGRQRARSLEAYKITVFFTKVSRATKPRRNRVVSATDPQNAFSMKSGIASKAARRVQRVTRSTVTFTPFHQDAR